MEFKGAYKLKKESFELNEELHPQLTFYEVKTRAPLQAIFKKGESAVTVLLKGENLHGNRNRYYWPTEAVKKLKAVVPEEAMASSRVFAENRKQIVRVVGEHLEIPMYEGKSLVFSQLETASVDTFSRCFFSADTIHRRHYCSVFCE